jgi:hypothetical protein
MTEGPRKCAKMAQNMVHGVQLGEDRTKNMIFGFHADHEWLEQQFRYSLKMVRSDPV